MISLSWDLSKVQRRKIKLRDRIRIKPGVSRDKLVGIGLEHTDVNYLMTSPEGRVGSIIREEWGGHDANNVGYQGTVVIYIDNDPYGIYLPYSHWQEFLEII